MDTTTTSAIIAAVSSLIGILITKLVDLLRSKSRGQDKVISNALKEMSMLSFQLKEELHEEIQRNRGEISQLKDELASLREENETLRTDNESLRERITELEETLKLQEKNS